MRAVVIASLLVVCAGVARADNERPVRKRDASVRQVLRGPFGSSHLFAMPTTDVVGAYILSIAGEGSLLSESDTFSGAGVAAIGFGDVAQLEYRLSAAFSNLGESDVLLPSLGVQFQIPLRERAYVPAFAVALRLGFARVDELDDGTKVHRFDEKVNDLYVVGRLHLWGPFRRFTLHGGLRVGAASIRNDDVEKKKTLWLPAGGWDVQMTPQTKLAGELALVPVFSPGINGVESRFETKPFGRLGIRWAIHPAFILDASLGYRIEVAKFDQKPTGGLDELIEWDIRLGAEVFVPWGALLCRARGALCE